MARGHARKDEIGAKDFSGLVKSSRAADIVSYRVLNPAGPNADRKIVVTTIDRNGKATTRTFDVRVKDDLLKRLGRQPGISPTSGTPNKSRGKRKAA